MRRLAFVWGLAFVIVLFPAAEASADGFSWDGFLDDDGVLRSVSGSADFSLSGSTLTLTLTNTLGVVEASQIQALTGLTWDMAGSINTVSAAVASGSGWVRGSDGASISDPGSAGQFWAFKDNVAAAGFGSIGVSAVGDLGGAGTGEYGSGDMIASGGPSPQPNGSDGGIVGTSFSGVNGNNGNNGPGPFIKNSVVFTFGLSSAPLDIAALGITNVQATYGTDGNPLVNVPEPTTLLLLGLGMIGLAGAKARAGGRRL